MKIRCRTCFGRGVRLRKNHFELDPCVKCDGTGKRESTFNDDDKVHAINQKIIKRKYIEEQKRLARLVEPV